MTDPGDIFTNLVGAGIDSKESRVDIMNGRIGTNLARFRMFIEKTPEQMVELARDQLSWDGDLEIYLSIESGDRPMTAVEMVTFAMALGLGPEQALLAFCIAPANSELRNMNTGTED